MESIESFPNGRIVSPVTVGLVEKTDRVWVSCDYEREKLMDELELFNLERFNGSVKTGTRAATVFSEDGRVYRCEVMKLEEDFLEVRYIDYGNLEKKTSKELFALPSNFVSRPALAIPMIVNGVHGVADTSKNRLRIEKKLFVEGLEVFVEKSDCNGVLVGQFSVCGKPIKFIKAKETASSSSLSVMETDSVTTQKLEPKANAIRTAEPDVVQKKEEVLKTSLESVRQEVEIKMFKELPSLKLLEGVSISGRVVYISPEGGVWFSPLWFQSSLDNMMDQLDSMEVSGTFVNVSVSQMKEGMLCLARFSEDGAMYRTRLISSCRQTKVVTVQFFDFGDTEEVDISSLFMYPDSLLHLAPGAEEVVLAEPPEYIGEDRRGLLQQTLMEVEGMVLLLEKDNKTGMKVGRFFCNDEEVIFKNKIESCEVHDKDKSINQDNSDVLVESEDINISEQISADTKNGIGLSKTEDFNTISQQESHVICIPAVPLPEVGETAVFLSYVENVGKVWVVRGEDQGLNSMERLAEITEELNPVLSVKENCVYGARYSEDNEMYRVVVMNIVEGDDINVRFIDHGNSEIKQAGDFYVLPVDIALIPAGAISIDIPDTACEEDHLGNRDELEVMLTGENVTVTKDGLFRVNGEVVMYEFNDSRVKEWIGDVINLREQNITLDDCENKGVDHLHKEKLESVGEIYSSNHSPGYHDLDLQPVVKKENAKLTQSEIVNDVAGKGKEDYINVEEDNMNVEEVNMNGHEEFTNIEEDYTNVDEDYTNFEEYYTTVDEDYTNIEVDYTNVEEDYTHAEEDFTHVKEDFTHCNEDNKYVEFATASLHLSELSSKRTSRPSQFRDQPMYVPPGLRKSVDTNIKIKSEKKINNKGRIISDNVAAKGDAIYKMGVFVTEENPVDEAEDTLVDKSEVDRTRRFKPGDEVLAQWPEGRWSSAIVSETANDKIQVENIKTSGKIWIGVDRVRSSGLPLTALNMIEKEYINTSKARMEEKADGENNFAQISFSSRISPENLPIDITVNGSEFNRVTSRLHPLVNFSQDSVQFLSDITTNSHVAVKLMTSIKGSLLLERLILMLPPAQLDCLVDPVGDNIYMLATHTNGSRVVQSLLLYLEREQSRHLVSRLLRHQKFPEVVKDKCGKFVAQTCLSVITEEHKLQLTGQLVGHIASLSCNQQANFFVQKLLEVLSPNSLSWALLLEDVLANIGLLVVDECGTRVVQAILKRTDSSGLLRVVRWMEMNIELIVRSRPAVFTSLALVKCLVVSGDGDARYLLDVLVRSLLIEDSSTGHLRLVVASLHPAGHLLVNYLLIKANSEDLLTTMARNVLLIKNNIFGAKVLKSLAGTI